MAQPHSCADSDGFATSLVRSLFSGHSSKSSGGKAFHVVALTIAAASGVAHFLENYAYIQHLKRIPDEGLAQVAALQTENAFYYSYYNELVEAETIAVGLERIIWDTRSEYPDVLNALRRFNIYQEVVLALAYRALRAVGLHVLNPWAFFRYSLLALNGLGHSAMSLLASEISGNPFAGVACYLFAFLNRFQISRLGNFSSSNLRETWGIPVLWAQTLALWWLISRRGLADDVKQRCLWWAFGTLTFIFFVVWQFSPFLLLLQATALYFVYLVLGFRELRSLVSRLIDVYLITMMLAVVIHFGSPYLITSPFLYQLVGLKIAVSSRLFLSGLCCHSGVSRKKGVASRFGWWILGRAGDVVEGLVAVAVFVLVSKVMKPLATADTHVYEILCTKVAVINDMLPKSIRLPGSRLPECTEPSFNARLYLIMGVFNILEASSLQIYMETTAGATAIAASAFVLLRFAFGCLNFGTSTGKMDDGEPVTSVSSASVTDVAASQRNGGDNGLRKRKGGAPDSHSKPSRDADASAQTAAVATQAARHALREDDEREEAALLFFVVQSGLFFILGGLVNRLRVAFGPPMMILAASCFGPRLFPIRWLLKKQCLLVVITLLLLHSLHTVWLVQQLPCVSSNDGICQHFKDKTSTDGDLADLADWMNRHLDPKLSVLASMNLGGSLRLYTNAPLIVHPQFESENLRKRVQLGYELYHCGSEASFVQTMKKLHADVVIFEYFRCFFTPYTLDDRRKNCIQNKHRPEDQLCLKLHAQSQHFELIFANGGYGVFRLRPQPLSMPGQEDELTAAEVKKTLLKVSTWKPYVDRCQAEQGEDCGPRLAELAATWHHQIKRPEVAATLRKAAETRFPDNGYVNYYLGRFWDYDSGDGGKAGKYYAKAVKAYPDNTIMLKEYIMWLDMVAKDSATMQKLLEERRGNTKKKRGPTPLLAMDTLGVGSLLCEATVSAHQQGMKKFGDEMWVRALKLAPLSSCVENNWQLVEKKRNRTQIYTDWMKVWALFEGGVQHEVQSHNQPAARFLGDQLFWTNPFRPNGTRMGA